MKKKSNKKKNVWAKQIKNQIDYIKKNKKIEIEGIERKAEAIHLLGAIFGAEIARDKIKYDKALEKLDKFNKENNNDKHEYCKEERRFNSNYR